jgi:hypothetical protein
VKLHSWITTLGQQGTEVQCGRSSTLGCMSLRRLMCNSVQRGRSPDRILHQTLSKGWCRHGSELLLGLIVRLRRRLVEAQARFGATESRSSTPAHRLGGFSIGTISTWRTKGSQELSGNGTGWRTTRLWWQLPRRTTPAEHGPKRIAAGPLASDRSSRGDKSTQGLLGTGAPSREDAGRPFNAFGGQDRGIHLGPTDQQLPWPTVAPPGGPVGLVHCTSLV